MLSDKQKRLIEELQSEIRSVKVTSLAVEQWQGRTLKALSTAASEAETLDEHAYRRAAQRLHHVDGYLEIDDTAVVSTGCERGAYVEAWVWVPEEALDGR